MQNFFGGNAANAEFSPSSACMDRKTCVQMYLLIDSVWLVILSTIARGRAMGNTASFSGGEGGPQEGGKDPEGGRLLNRTMDALQAAGFDQENAACHVG